MTLNACRKEIESHFQAGVAYKVAGIPQAAVHLSQELIKYLSDTEERSLIRRQ